MGVKKTSEESLLKEIIDLFNKINEQVKENTEILKGLKGSYDVNLRLFKAISEDLKKMNTNLNILNEKADLLEEIILKKDETKP